MSKRQTYHRIKLGAALLGLLLLLPLGGCSLLLDRDYVTESVHNQFSDEEAGSDVLGAETYQGLVSAVLHLISQGQETGVIRLYNYTGAAESDLDAACLEVTQKDPMGVYAVEYIQYDLSRVVSYYQADLTISYRRSAEQIASVVSVTGNGGIENGIREALTQYRSEAVFRVSYFEGDQDAVKTMLTDAYYDVPAAAMGLPKADVTLYPETGQQRVVEITLTYPKESKVLTEKKKTLAALTEKLTASLSKDKGEALEKELIALIRGRVTYMPQGGNTAYDALTDGAADAEGMALALQLLCQQTGLESRVVRGSWNGEPWYWNVVQVDGVWRHVDLTQADASHRQDQAMVDGGYQWDVSRTPACPG